MRESSAADSKINFYKAIYFEYEDHVLLIEEIANIIIYVYRAGKKVLLVGQWRKCSRRITLFHAPIVTYLFCPACVSFLGSNII